MYMFSFRSICATLVTTTGPERALCCQAETCQHCRYPTCDIVSGEQSVNRGNDEALLYSTALDFGR